MFKTLPISFILFVSTLLFATSHHVPDSGLTTHCDNVIEKLELSALSETPKSSGLTIKELNEAHNEASGWSYQDADDIKSQKPLIHLLINLLPTKALFLTETNERENFLLKTNKLYISRIESYYKTLRRNYLNRNAGLVDSTLDSKRTDKLEGLVENLINQRSVLSKNDFIDAIEQYNSLLRELNEYPTKDIVKNRNKLQGLINVINIDEYQFLARYIFPKIKIKDNQPLTDEEIEEFKQTYMMAMEESGYKVVDGLKIDLRTNLPPPT